LRIIQANGGLVNGTVPINCVIEVDLTPQGEAAVERLRAAAGGGQHGLQPDRVVAISRHRPPGTLEQHAPPADQGI
jgi:hypothetical protein